MASLEVEARPPWPYRLARSSGGDGVVRARGEVVARLLHVRERPVAVLAWQRRSGEVVLRAAGDDRALLAEAIARVRFALGVDDDLRPFYERFRSDPLLGPAIRQRPWLRPRRRPLAWEALAWAVTKQLIEAEQAAAIQRRIVRRFGPRVEVARIGELRDVPSPGAIAALAPAELEACDLAPARALALVRAAREVAAGRVDPARGDGDARLAAIRGIGPWTLQCLALFGRGDADSLPAGDLGYLKVVGRLAGLGRRATIPEVEEFFAPYAPYRGLAGVFCLVHYHERVAQGPPLRLAPGVA